jgi:hypothetical protein
MSPAAPISKSTEAFLKVGRLLKKLPWKCADFAALHTNFKKREKLQSQFQK